MSMRVSLILLDWAPEEVFLKTAPEPVVDASVVIINEGFYSIELTLEYCFSTKLYPVYHVNLYRSFSKLR